MVSLIKDLSILKKFLFINLIVFIVIGILTVAYLKSIQPGLIKKKTSNHIRVIDNTIDHIKRLNIEFSNKDIKKFLLSTRFLFQNLDSVIFLDNKNNLIADTDTLDLDHRSFSQRLEIIEFENLTVEKKIEVEEKKEISTKGITKYTSNGFSYNLTKKFFIEAEKNRVLQKPIRFTKPIVLMHGLKDNIVNEDVPRKILKKVNGKNVNNIYLKESDHRLSTETDLKMITQSIDYIRHLKK